MKVGDCVKLTGTLFSTWTHQDQIGIVVSRDCFVEGLLIAFHCGEVVDFSGFEEHFEVINESR